jgi:BarA-like signal transduction histidine kinase
MDEFVIYHVPREENLRANALAQQASSHNIQKRMTSHLVKNLLRPLFIQKMIMMKCMIGGSL